MANTLHQRVAALASGKDAIAEAVAPETCAGKAGLIGPMNNPSARRAVTQG